MTASYKEKQPNENQLLPRFCESMGDQILSLFCLLFDQTQQNGSVIGMHDQVVGLLSLRCIFLLFAGKALRQVASFFPSVFVSLFSY